MGLRSHRDSDPHSHLWSLGNFVTHPRDIWPEERQLNISEPLGVYHPQRQLSFNRIMRTNYSDDSLASAAYRLGLKPHRRADAQMASCRPTNRL